MAQMYAFPKERIVGSRATIPTMPILALPGYGNPVPFDKDGRGGSLSDRWRDMCSRHGVEAGIRLVSRIPMLERSSTLEIREKRDASEYVIFLRDLGQGRGIAAVFPRIVLFESRHQRVLFFAKGHIDGERTVAVLGRQLGDALRQS